MRQWVLTAPFEVRRVMALRPEALSACNRIFVQEIARWQKTAGRIAGGETGSVTFVQRFNATLGNFVHFALQRGARAHTARGVPAALPLRGPVPSPGPRRTTGLRRRPRARLAREPVVAEVDGFNVHAGVVVQAGDREGLERLCRYGARPPFSLERLSRLADGRVAYLLRKPRKNRSGRSLRAGDAPDTPLSRSLARALHVNDEGRLDRWREWLAADGPPPADPRDPLMLMLFVALGQIRRPVDELGVALSEVWGAPDLREELRDLLDLVADRSRRATWPLAGVPFRVHGTYSRDEISAGLMQIRKGKIMRTQGGVFKCKDARTDVLYVELDKEPKHYTPTTLYDDYAISPTRFHWESQGKTRADSETGRRYITHEAQGWPILLFVRKAKEDGRGFTSPYTFLGPVRYVSHESEKPMRIVWELEREMPAEFFAEIKIAAG